MKLNITVLHNFDPVRIKQIYFFMVKKKRRTTPCSTVFRHQVALPPQTKTPTKKKTQLRFWGTFVDHSPPSRRSHGFSVQKCSFAPEALQSSSVCAVCCSPVQLRCVFKIILRSVCLFAAGAASRPQCQETCVTECATRVEQIICLRVVLSSANISTKPKYSGVWVIKYEINCLF